MKIKDFSVSKLEFSESQVCKTIWTNLRRFFRSSGELLENASRPTGSCSMHGWLKTLRKLLRFWAVNGSNFLAETRTGISILSCHIHLVAPEIFGPRARHGRAGGGQARQGALLGRLRFVWRNGLIETVWWKWTNGELLRKHGEFVGKPRFWWPQMDVSSSECQAWSCHSSRILTDSELWVENSDTDHAIR